MKIDEHKKQFGNLAEDYTKYRGEYEPELYGIISSNLQSNDKKILDIACGTGKSTEPLVKSGLEVFGCDHDPLMIEEAKKQAELKGININYSVADVEELPFESGEFDAVTVGTAFHWFVNERAINEIKRVLRDNGLLVIFWSLTTKETPEEDSIPSELFQKYNWERVPSELRDLDHISTFLNGNGFSDVSTHRIPSINKYTVEEYVGLMKTASSFGVLSDENKIKFENELTAILTEKLGNRDHFTLEDEIQVCLGRKK